MTQLREKVKIGVEEWLGKSSERKPNQIAKQAGIAPATMTNLLKKPETNISDSMLMKIARAISLKLTQEKHWQFDEGRAYQCNFTKIKRIVEEASRSKTDFWIDAPSGAGKSYTFQHLRDKNRGIDGAVQIAYVELKQGMSNTLICQLLLKGHYTDRQMNKLPKQAGKLREILAEKLLSIGSEKPLVLVIDQMEFGMSVSKLKFLHGLWDLVQGEIPVIFVGAHTLPIIAKKGLQQEKNYFNQVATRFQNGFRLIGGIDAEYIRRVCEFEGFTNQSAIEWFIYHCKHFRMLTSKIKKANDLCIAKNISPSDMTDKKLNSINKSSIDTLKALDLCD